MMPRMYSRAHVYAVCVYLVLAVRRRLRRLRLQPLRSSEPLPLSSASVAQSSTPRAASRPVGRGAAMVPCTWYTAAHPPLPRSAKRNLPYGESILPFPVGRDYRGHPSDESDTHKHGCPTFSIAMVVARRSTVWLLTTAV